MKILSICISNFLSIESISLSFEDNGLVLIEGVNKDDNRSNGSGKTAIFNALAFGLYEKIPRKILKSEFLRNGTKEGYVEVNIQVDDNIYKVIRHRPKGLNFYKNNEQLDITQEEFEKIIKLNYDQFLITMYTAQDGSNKQQFLDLNDSQKKDFFIDLMKLGDFDFYKKQVQNTIAKFKAELQSTQFQIGSLSSQVGIYKSNIANEETLNQHIFNHHQEIQQLLDKSTQINEEISTLTVSKPDTSNLDTKLQKLQQYRQVKIQRETEIGMLKNSISKLELDKTKEYKYNTHNCPECDKQIEIINNKPLKFDEEQIVIARQHHIKEIDIEIDSINSSIKEKQDVVNKLVNINDNISNVQSQINTILNDFNNSKSRVDMLKSQISMLNNQKRTIENSINNYNQQIQNNKNNITKQIETEGRIITYKEKEENILLEISLHEELLKVFSPQGAQSYILDDIVETFNKEVEQYISLIWPNTTYTLKTYKENKDKNISTKFSETLVKNGYEVSIGSLSGGEKCAISLAIDFAVINLVNNYFGLQLNPIIKDEPFTGLDIIGKETVIGLLQQISQDKQIFVVDHASEAKTLFNKVITIQKQNGKSSII